MASTLFNKGAMTTPALTDILYMTTNASGAQDEGFITVTDLRDLMILTKFVVIRPDKLEIAQYLSGGVYSLPANNYVIQGTVDFGTDRIELSTNSGFYQISSPNFGTMTYSGTTAFIQNASGVTDIILDIRHFFITTPNATAIKIANGNSFMCDLVAFLLCAKPFDLDTVSFCTLEALPIVACDTGSTIKDADTITARLYQYNAGPATGGVGLTVSGAASGRLIMNACDARPESTESYLDIQASYAGDVQISGGAFKTGGGTFFKAATRDQTDVDIDLQNVKNVQSSTVSCGAYITDANTASTVLSAVDTITVIAGTWTIDSSERITATTAGKFTYDGKEDTILSVALKMHCDPASGSNRTYDSYIRKNGSTLILLSRDTITADAANPAKMVLFATMPMVTTDYFEVVIENKTNNVDVTCEANSLIISMG